MTSDDYLVVVIAPNVVRFDVFDPGQKVHYCSKVWTADEAMAAARELGAAATAARPPAKKAKKK